MKLNVRDIILDDLDRQEFLRGLVNEALALAIKKNMDCGDYTEVEIKLLVEGEEVDITNVCDDWQSQVDEVIREEALSLFEEKILSKFSDISDLALELEERLKEEVKKYLEDGEDIDYLY